MTELRLRHSFQHNFPYKPILMISNSKHSARSLTARLSDDKFQYYLMFLPALILLVGIMYPFITGVYISFTNEKLYLPTVEFIGFGNYVNLISDRVFQQSVVTVIKYTLLVLVIQIPLGFAVAILLDETSPLQKFFRSSVVLPLLIPPIIAGLMWKTMMQPEAGVINWALQSIGLPAFSWLSNPKTALFSIVIIDTWVFMPFAALILLAGLQSVSHEIIEASKIDGASTWQILRFVKLPWMTPYILLVMVFRVADSLKTFELIYPTTRGGPLNATRVMHVLGYEEAFRWANMGRAMAIIFMLWLISYIVSNRLVKTWEKSSEETKGEF